MVTTLTDRRTVERCEYVTSPGDRVVAIATDLGVLERRDGAFVVTAVVPGALETLRSRIAWDVAVATDVVELDPPTPEEVLALRTWDPQGFFLR